MEEIKEMASTLLSAMQPGFADYHPPEAEVSARNGHDAVLVFMSVVWSGPPTGALYTASLLGLRGGDGLYVYRKRGKQTIYRARLEFYRDELTITPFWDVEVKRVGRKRYYCKLVDYGVVVRGEHIRPILKL